MVIEDQGTVRQVVGELSLRVTRWRVDEDSLSENKDLPFGTMLFMFLSSGVRPFLCVFFSLISFVFSTAVFEILYLFYIYYGSLCKFYYNSGI